MSATINLLRRERDSLARRLAVRFEETEKLRTRIEELEIALAEVHAARSRAEASVRATENTNIRNARRELAEFWPMLKATETGEIRTGHDLSPIGRLVDKAGAVASYMETVLSLLAFNSQETANLLIETARLRVELDDERLAHAKTCSNFEEFAEGRHEERDVTAYVWTDPLNGNQLTFDPHDITLVLGDEAHNHHYNGAGQCRCELKPANDIEATGACCCNGCIGEGPCDLDQSDIAEDNDDAGWQVGDITYGGIVTKDTLAASRLERCPDCGDEQWIHIGGPDSVRCPTCGLESSVAVEVTP